MENNELIPITFEIVTREYLDSLEYSGVNAFNDFMHYLCSHLYAKRENLGRKSERSKRYLRWCCGKEKDGVKCPFAVYQHVLKPDENEDNRRNVNDRNYLVSRDGIKMCREQQDGVKDLKKKLIGTHLPRFAYSEEGGSIKLHISQPQKPERLNRTRLFR